MFLKDALITTITVITQTDPITIVAIATPRRILITNTMTTTMATITKTILVALLGTIAGSLEVLA